MDYIFKGMLIESVEIDVDDIIVKSDSCQQHVKDAINATLVQEIEKEE